MVFIAIETDARKYVRIEGTGKPTIIQQKPGQTKPASSKDKSLEEVQAIVEPTIPDDTTLTRNSIAILEQQGYTPQGAYIDNRFYPYGSFSVRFQSGREVTPRNYAEMVGAYNEEQRGQYRLHGSFYVLQGYRPVADEQGVVSYVKPSPIVDPDYHPESGDVQREPGGPIVNVPPEQQPRPIDAVQRRVGEAYDVLDVFGVGAAVQRMPSREVWVMDPSISREEMLAGGMQQGVSQRDIVLGMLPFIQLPGYVSGLGAAPQVLSRVVPPVLTRGLVKAATGVMVVASGKDIVEEKSPTRQSFGVALFAGQLLLASRLAGARLSSLRYSNLKAFIGERVPRSTEVTYAKETGFTTVRSVYDVMGLKVRSPFYRAAVGRAGLDFIVRETPVEAVPPGLAQSRWWKPVWVSDDIFVSRSGNKVFVSPLDAVFSKYAPIEKPYYVSQKDIPITTKEQFDITRRGVTTEYSHRPKTLHEIYRFIREGPIADIEPQVYTAVKVLQEKGYQTFSSGFFREGEQNIEFFMQRGGLKQSTVDIIKSHGFTVEEYAPGNYSISINQLGLSLSDVKGRFDSLARDIPPLNNTTSRWQPQTGTSEPVTALMNVRRVPPGKLVEYDPVFGVENPWVAEVKNTLGMLSPGWQPQTGIPFPVEQKPVSVVDVVKTGKSPLDVVFKPKKAEPVVTKIRLDYEGNLTGTKYGVTEQAKRMWQPLTGVFPPEFQSVAQRTGRELWTTVFPKPTVYVPPGKLGFYEGPSLNIFSFLESGQTLQTEGLIKPVSGKKRVFTFEDIVKVTEKPTSSGGTTQVQRGGQQTILEPPKVETVMEPPVVETIEDLVSVSDEKVIDMDTVSEVPVGMQRGSQVTQKRSVSASFEETILKPLQKTASSSLSLFTPMYSSRSVNASALVFDRLSVQEQKRRQVVISGLSQVPLSAQQQGIRTLSLADTRRIVLTEGLVFSLDDFTGEFVDIVTPEYPRPGEGRITRPKPPIPDFDKKMKEASDEMSPPESYIVKFRKRQYVDGKRVNDRTYHGSKRYTFFDALSYGMYVADNTEKASFELEPSDRKPQRLPSNIPDFMTKVGEYKQTKPNRWVELPRHRLDSPGEIKAITMRGIEANRRRR